MSDYPDPDEEFELMYGDDLELLREQDDEEHYEPPIKTTKTAAPSAERSVNNVENASEGTFNNSPLLFPTQNVLSSTTTDVFSQQTLQSNLPIEDSSSKKRNADELFGDIGDLDIEDFEIETQLNKKTKLSKEEELRELMEHIILLRKLNEEKSSILSVNKGVSKSTAERDRHNVTYRVPKYPFVGIKRFDGERVYVRFHSEEYEKEEIKKIVEKSSGAEILGDSSSKIWEEARNLITKQLTDQLVERDEEISILEETEGDKQLWTDLYKPKKYIELLSDESTNRIMLKWLKLWDKVVFNRRPRIKPIRPVENNKNNFKFKKFELNTELDEHGRPQYKVALLCGPPGLGKTTLAHVAARHAGYNVVEINASDDRSVDAFKTSLESATQMRSVVDREGRPNCLVFDEIDGAPQSSIEFLIKFINGTAKSKSKKGKNQKDFVLKRPIICICNDVYVPALRPLRQIAFVVNFPQTSTSRLAERLMSISRREGIKTDLGAMMALAEKSNNDIRSCLSVLHFFKAQNKAVTLSDVYRVNIGQKDMHKGLFAVWQEIFQIQRPKHNTYDSVHKQAPSTRMSRILQTISSFGDYERVAQGVYENFPLLKLKDSTLEGSSRAMDWFVFSDILNKQIHTLQNYTLFSYLPYAFAAWHFLFATTQSQKLAYPSTGYEMKQKEIRRKAIVSEVLRGMQPLIRAHCHRLSLILDVLPLIIHIIVPNFRPVSLHLYTKEEKSVMLNVVNTMIDYNLNYVQERSPDGGYVFNLEPNIGELMCLEKSGSTKSGEVKSLSYSNKQLVAREIELEKMRRFEVVKDGGEEKRMEKRGKEDARESEKRLPNHLQTLKAMKAKSVQTKKEVVVKDFFGRIVTKKETSSGRSGTHVKNDVWYQYKEGYNNAVRKNIKMSDLL